MVIIIGLTILFSTFEIRPAKSELPQDLECYGFLVPLPSGEDTTYETFVNSKVRHLINDLLREDIQVYWAAIDFLALSKEMKNESNIQERWYAKGTFIVPFTSDTFQNALTTAIVYDYNQTNELEENETIQIEVYKLMNPLYLDGYTLQEPKIAQHLGRPTRYGWPAYLQIADAGGFLTMEFLLDNETGNLNIDDYNVFMWPYNPDPGTILEQLASLSNKKTCNSVREFVRDGGGYIGSCYGALAASSGFLRPFPQVTVRRAYFPNLPCLVPSFTFSISDSIMEKQALVKKGLHISTTEIVDTNHPISYGLNKTVQEFFDGPWFIWLGRNTKEVGVFSQLTYVDEDPNYNSRIRKIADIVNGTTSWVHTSFGEGKIVLFASHPEFVNNISLLFYGLDWKGDKYYGRRTIHNSLFYVTSQGPQTTNASTSYPVSLIEELGKKTSSLPIEDANETQFAKIIQRISNFKTNLTNLMRTSFEMGYKFFNRYNETELFEQGIRLFIYTFYFCMIYHDFMNRTIDTLEKIDQVCSTPSIGNDSNLELVEDLKVEISSRLNHAEQLMEDVLSCAYGLNETLNDEETIGQKLIVLNEGRRLLRTFEIGLKYIPQMYFESLKLLRQMWYQYEASVALE